MPSNPSLYRYINFIGGNILDASNVTLLQTELGKLGSQGAGQLYVQGTLLNAAFNIVGVAITFTHASFNLPVWVTLNPYLVGTQIQDSNGNIQQVIRVSGTGTSQALAPTWSVTRGAITIDNPGANQIVWENIGVVNTHIFAFINGQFEDLGAAVSISGVQPTTGAKVPLFLNWSWDKKVSTDDPTFIDGTTGEPTIEAGQLSFDVSWVDNSVSGDSTVTDSNPATNPGGVPVNSAVQFAKNATPIVIAYFDMSVPLTVTVNYINGIQPYATGTPTQAGLTRLTDNTGLAPGNQDPRLSDQRIPLDNSITNPKVKALIQTGFNSSGLLPWVGATVYAPGQQILDSNGNIETVVAVMGTGTSGALAPIWNLTLGGPTIDNPGANQITWVNGGPGATPRFDPATPNQGGIFSDSIIYTTLKQKLTGFLDSVNTNIQNTLIALGNHIGKPLGSSETHPFPTAFQVGAAPASHVGQVLGLGTSHPAQVNSDHAGFVVLRNPLVIPVSTDYAYALTDGTTVLTGLKHTGDVWSILANAANAQGGNGTGGTAVNTGPLGLMSLIARVLAEHVNYKVHGNNNPHNLNAADIGSASQLYVDTQDASILAQAEAYTDAHVGKTIRANSYATLGSNVALNTVDTFVMSTSITTPVSGGPWRLLVSYGLYVNSLHGDFDVVFSAHISDGASVFASGQEYIRYEDSLTSGAGGVAGSQVTNVTYPNNHTVNLTLFASCTSAFRANAAARTGNGQNSWMSASVVSTS